MRDPDHLEAPGQALGQPPLHEEWRRSEEHDPERYPLRRVLVPESLQDLRPAGDLLHLVQDKKAASSLALDRPEAPQIPLLPEPASIPAGRVVGRRVMARKARQFTQDPE